MCDAARYEAYNRLGKVSLREKICCNQPQFSTVMRILIIEDEPRLLRNLARALREEGYAVDVAAAGDEGLYKAESYNYDAIVLDIMLPRHSCNSRPDRK